MKPELSNGQSHFWQWDTKQKIKVDGEAKELHYIGIDGAVEVDGDGWAAVPDELLQNSGTLLGWAYLTDHTVERFTVGVSPRSKPPDYVYTPTEVKTWTELEKKIRELEESGVSADTIEAAVSKWLENNPIAVTEEDPTVPDWAKAAEKPTYTAEEVGALTADTLQAATENALAQAKASGAFDGKKGDKGDPGEPGKDGAGINVTGATVGQIVKIAAVDDTGAPTAWEPVDMPSGGGRSSEWEELVNIELQEASAIKMDDLPDAYTALWGRIIVPKTDTAINLGASYFLGATAYYCVGSSTQYAYVIEALTVKIHGDCWANASRTDIVSGLGTSSLLRTRSDTVAIKNEVHKIHISAELPAGTTMIVYGRK